jgi:hypothetical protein
VITYVAINLTNKKFYVGSTVDFTKRQKSHLKSNEDYPFQNSLRKDPNNFYWIVGEDDGLVTRDEEQCYLDFYHGTTWCYNLNPKAAVSPSPLGKGGPGHHLHGRKQDPEHIARRTAHCSGETNPVYGKQWWNDGNDNYALSVESPGEGWTLGGKGLKEPLSGEKNPMYGMSGELSPCYGTKWYNDQVTEKKFKSDPGKGWVRGRIKRNK